MFLGTGFFLLLIKFIQNIHWKCDKLNEKKEIGII